jgi:hypothetical protein
MIAIIDFKNQDIGLKILFPEADYFILEEEFDRTRLNEKHNINTIIHSKTCDVYNYITDKKYNILFIISPIYGALNEYNNFKKDVDENTKNKFANIMNLIQNNNFTSVCIFDNYDYDYDPNILSLMHDDYKNIIINKNIIFFKRYCNKYKSYKPNVFPFPYITFGYIPILDILLDKYSEKNNNDKINRIFFCGSLFNHNDPIYGITRNKRDIIIKIMQKLNINLQHNLPHSIMMEEMCKSKYCLDVLGVGDPNTRTFEILSSGSLKIGQRTNLKWNFDDNFCEETFFNDENDLYAKIIFLENNPDIYEKCLLKQNEIVNKYMNKNYLRNYIMDCITNYHTDEKYYN